MKDPKGNQKFLYQTKDSDKAGAENPHFMTKRALIEEVLRWRNIADNLRKAQETNDNSTTTPA